MKRIIISENQLIFLIEQNLQNKFTPIPLDKVYSTPQDPGGDSWSSLSKSDVEKIVKSYNQFYTNLQSSGDLKPNSDLYDEFEYYLREQYGLNKMVNVKRPMWVYDNPETGEKRIFGGSDKNNPPRPGLGKKFDSRYLKWVENYETMEKPDDTKYKPHISLVHHLSSIHRRLFSGKG